MNKINIENKVIYYSAFSTLAVAKRWAFGCNKMHLIILGDNEKFWVVTPADAEKLVKMGYEYA
ncbi:MAG: hypothetical protein MJZ20_03665 [Bacteroidaceae bacterium]|nr:hypothetical protein [Bacteroidaceae bacterium]